MRVLHRVGFTLIAIQSLLESSSAMQISHNVRHVRAYTHMGYALKSSPALSNRFYSLPLSPSINIDQNKSKKLKLPKNRKI